MEFLSNEMYVSEMSCGTDFAYILTDKITMSDTEYKVLQNQKDSFFIKCVKTKFNGRTQLYYSVRNYRTLENLSTKLDTVSFYTIMGNILSNIVEMRKNGFLSCQNVLFSPDKIYVDMGTLSVFLVYVPTNLHIYDDLAEFESNLRTRMIRMISEYDIHMTPEIKRLYENLTDSTLSLDNIYAQISGLTEDGVGAGDAVTKRIQLRPVNIPMLDVIQITKPEFVIGKNQNVSDATISINPAISRSHCKLITREEGFYLEDLNSSNGTFLNGRKVFPGNKERLQNGDVIRLANMEFKVEIV